MLSRRQFIVNSSIAGVAATLPLPAFAEEARYAFFGHAPLADAEVHAVPRMPITVAPDLPDWVFRECLDAGDQLQCEMAEEHYFAHLRQTTGITAYLGGERPAYEAVDNIISLTKVRPMGQNVLVVSRASIDDHIDLDHPAVTPIRGEKIYCRIANTIDVYLDASAIGHMLLLGHVEPDPAQRRVSFDGSNLYLRHDAHERWRRIHIA